MSNNNDLNNEKDKREEKWQVRWDRRLSVIIYFFLARKHFFSIKYIKNLIHSFYTKVVLNLSNRKRLFLQALTIENLKKRFTKENFSKWYTRKKKEYDFLVAQKTTEEETPLITDLNYFKNKNKKYLSDYDNDESATADDGSKQGDYVHAKHRYLSFTDLGYFTFIITLGKFAILSFFAILVIRRVAFDYPTIVFKFLLFLVIIWIIYIVLEAYHYLFFFKESAEEIEITVHQFNKKVWARWDIKFYAIFRYLVTGRSLKLSQLIYYRKYVIAKILKKMIQTYGWETTKYYFKMYFTNVHMFKISWNLDQLESLIFWHRPGMHDGLAEPDEFFNLEGEMIRTENKHIIGKHWNASESLDISLDTVDNFFCIRDIEWLNEIGDKHIHKINLQAHQHYQQLQKLEVKKERFSKYYATLTHAFLHHGFKIYWFLPPYCLFAENNYGIDIIMLILFYYRPAQIWYLSFEPAIQGYASKPNVSSTLDRGGVPTVITDSRLYLVPIYRRKGRLLKRSFSDLRAGNKKFWIRILRKDLMGYFTHNRERRWYKRWLFWKWDYDIIPWRMPRRRPGEFSFCYRLDEWGGFLIQHYRAYDEHAPAIVDTAVHLSFEGKLVKKDFDADLALWYCKKPRAYKGSYNLRYSRFDFIDWHSFRRHVLVRVQTPNAPSTPYLVRKPYIFWHMDGYRTIYAIPEIATYDNTALEFSIAELNELNAWNLEGYRWLYTTNFYSLMPTYKNKMDLGYRYGYSSPDRWYIKAKNYSLSDDRYERTWADRSNEILVRNTANNFREPLPVTDLTLVGSAIEFPIEIPIIMLVTLISVYVASRRVQLLFQGRVVFVILLFSFYFLFLIQELYGMLLIKYYFNTLLGAWYIPFWQFFYYAFIASKKIAMMSDAFFLLGNMSI